MKFPTIEELARNVAEKALDEYEYKGNTLRQWIEIISASEHGTNLAEVGTDCISRQQAIDAIDEIESEIAEGFGFEYEKWRKYFCDLPPAQPERIKGHWIEIALSNHTYKCSVCGRLLVNITDGKNNVAKNYPYCHCGADMREVTE